eukprot:CAMPEP_0174727714 /NCGR_PEP_ID=MMETSP1094-20130205/50339_1 /TAXON_ID=156173 /ORGANISM="Chrysochromulina brevifilum, Strain UTEX LB 985" /LENGTH=144 /DNA_ID=CAMNT_0015929519 /DNA_START=105 /DNA_END=540 /DNA_ORIENTATION=+
MYTMQVVVLTSAGLTQQRQTPLSSVVDAATAGTLSSGSHCRDLPVSVPIVLPSLRGVRGSPRSPVAVNMLDRRALVDSSSVAARSSALLSASNPGTGGKSQESVSVVLDVKEDEERAEACALRLHSTPDMASADENEAGFLQQC